MDNQSLHRLLTSDKLTKTVGRAVMKAILKAVIRAEAREESSARHPAGRPVVEIELSEMSMTVPTSSEPAEDRLRWLLDRFTRRWVCQVVRTGFHNGARCSPDDPHDPSWRCGWRNEASLNDDQMKVISTH